MCRFSTPEKGKDLHDSMDSLQPFAEPKIFQTQPQVLRRLEPLPPRQAAKSTWAFCSSLFTNGRMSSSMHHGMPDRSKMHNSSPFLPCHPHEYLDPHPSILIDLAFKLGTAKCTRTLSESEQESLLFNLLMKHEAWPSIPNPPTLNSKSFNPCTEHYWDPASCCQIPPPDHPDEMGPQRTNIGVLGKNNEKQQGSRPLCHCGSYFWGFTLTMPAMSKRTWIRLVRSFSLELWTRESPTTWIL